MWIDTHAHLTSSSLLSSLDAVLERAQHVGIEMIVNICTDLASLEAATRLISSGVRVVHAAATTPHDVEKEGESFLFHVEKHLEKLVALGETGLDYFYEHSAKKVQQQFLSRYFALAIKSRLPLIFHCRDAFSDLFALAEEQYAGKPALLHCFTGTLDEARGVLDRGWLISLSGIVTFKKSQALCEVARYVPLDRLVIETDAPYLAPQSRRGKENEPSFLPETAAFIAQLKGVDLPTFAAATTANATRFFSLCS